MKKCILFKTQVEISNKSFQKYVLKQFAQIYLEDNNSTQTYFEEGNNETKLDEDNESIASEDMEVEYLEEDFLQSIPKEDENEKVINTEEEMVENTENFDLKNECITKQEDIITNNHLSNIKVDIESTFDNVEKNLEELFNGEVENNPIKIEARCEILQDDKKYHSCFVCKKFYLTPNLLITHIVQRHKHLSIYTCVYPNCNEKFSSCNELQKHNILHTDTHVKKIQCKICSKLFVSEKDCKEHTESHIGKNFKCNICSKIFVNEHIMKTHRNRHEKKTIWLCSDCGKTFLTKGELEVHSNIHTENKYECCICEKTFKFKSNLYSHRQAHFGAKQFLCMKCGLSFSKSSNLQAHLLRHDSIKNFTCLICGMKFCTQSELKIHIRKHTNEKLYECSVCQLTFKTISTLKIHSAKHEQVNVTESESKYTCELCNATFDKSDLKRHLKLHTG